MLRMEKPWKHHANWKQQDTCCMISLIWDIKNKQIQRDKRQFSGRQMVGRGKNGEWLKMGPGFSFGGDEKVLTLDGGDGGNIMNVFNFTELYTLKWKILWYVHFITTKKIITSLFPFVILKKKNHLKLNLYFCPIPYLLILLQIRTGACLSFILTMLPELPLLPSFYNII